MERIVLLLHHSITASKHAKVSGEEGVVAVGREVGLGRLDQTLPAIVAAADFADVAILAAVAAPYAVLRRFSPRFLAAFRFQSCVPHSP